MSTSLPERDARDDGAGRPPTPRPAGAAPSSTTLVDHFRSVFLARPDDTTFRFLADGEGEPSSLTNAQLDLRVRALAATLRQRVAPGDRALIVCPPGLDYVIAFLACLYAKVIAVPVYPPDPVLLKRTLPRLRGVIADARPAIVLAPDSIAAMAGQLAEQAPALGALAWQHVDGFDPAVGEDWTRPDLGRDDLAFLQYTSGSTGRAQGGDDQPRQPAAQLGSIHDCFGCDRDEPAASSGCRCYHDMGLIGGVLQPLYGGVPA